MNSLSKIIAVSLLLTPIGKAIAQSKFPADYNHIIGYGQSLSVGSVGRIFINSTGLPYNNTLMFNNGLRYTKGEADSSMSRFVPLVEHGSGETPTSGTADMLMKTMIKDQQRPDYSFIFRTPGAGGKSVKVLRRNTQQPHYYESALRAVRQGKAIAHQQRKTFNVPAFTWTQGEADISAGMTMEEYKRQFTELYTEMNKDIKAITEQSNDVVAITYQTASHNRYFLGSAKEDKFLNTNIAVAQYQMAIADNKIYMATPMYPFDYAPDNVHLYIENTRLLGAYYGYVTKKVLIDKIDWKPVYPKTITAAGKMLKLKMHVPVKPLVIDTDWVQWIDNYGFNLYRKDREMVIKDVKLTGADEITIWTSEDLMNGDKLTYAMNGENSGRFIGSRGNIRDSQGNTVTYDIGCTTYKLHNWMPIFEETIKQVNTASTGVNEAVPLPIKTDRLVQPMSELPVFGYEIKEREGIHSVLANHEFTSKQDGMFNTQFFLKLIPRNVDAEINLQYFDPAKADFVTIATRLISQKDQAIYNQWVNYSIGYDSVKFENKKGTRYRLAIKAVKVDTSKRIHLLKAHQNNSMFITGIKSVYTSAPKLANGNFELWDAVKWPAKPVGWRVVEGQGCMERFRGHMLDDYALKLTNPIAKLTRFSTLNPVALKNKTYTIQFYARAEQKGHKLSVYLPHSKQTKTIQLDKIWRQYTVEVSGSDAPQTLELQYRDQGAIYIDEVEFLGY